MGCGTSAPSNYVANQPKRAQFSAPTTHTLPYPTEGPTELGFVAQAGNPTLALASLAASSSVPDQSPGGSAPATSVMLHNNTQTAFEVFWRDFEGAAKPYGSLQPGARQSFGTYAGHVWVLVRQGSDPKPKKAPPDKKKDKNKATRQPPYHGTVWFSKQLIVGSDPTAFTGLTSKGKGKRSMFDRRLQGGNGGQLDGQAWLFAAGLGGSPQKPAKEIEVQANAADFDSAEAARKEAEPLLAAVGKLPAFLLAKVETVWLHGGDAPFGGGNNNLLMYTGAAKKYVQDGVLEETLLHEATHTSCQHLQDEAGWLKAQREDPTSSSKYARDNPSREDVAETMGPYLGLRFRGDRLSEQQKKSVSENIPHRVKYLDSLNLSMDIMK